jgi:hypothetical protein
MNEIAIYFGIIKFPNNINEEPSINKNNPNY